MIPAARSALRGQAQSHPLVRDWNCSIQNSYLELHGSGRCPKSTRSRRKLTHSMTNSDGFVFAGEVFRFEGMRETDAIVTRSHAPEPKVPSYDGGKFPLSTYLADRVRRLLADQI